jgi:hypothetical protein
MVQCKRLSTPGRVPPLSSDNAAAGRAGFMPIAELFSKRDLRAQDTATFLTQNQMRFYQETYNYLKKGLGYKASIYASKLGDG